MSKSNRRVVLSLDSLEERLVMDGGLLLAPTTSTAHYAMLEVAGSSNTLGAEQVLRWNTLALNAIATNRTAPPLAARQLAILSVAMYDAANSITRQGTNYYPMPGRPPAKTSVDVAVGVAANRVLSVLFPNQKALFKAELQHTLALAPKGMPRVYGQLLGSAVANRILRARATDGSSNTVIYASTGLVGRWEPTPPAFAQQPLLPQWPGVKPFAITSTEQFRSAPPPALTSQQYTTDFNEVKELGATNSTTRTADQTEIARFWAAGAGTVTPPGMWNVFAQEQARSANLSTTQTAKLLAALNVAMADAGIACWDTKYFYDMWRPVTAIRKADLDGNADTTQDTAWTSLIGTPPFPTYTSGHSTFSAAAAEVLSAFFGAQTSFTGTSDGLTGVTRQWTSFRSAAVEAGDSRVYGGIHFRFDSTAGIECGISIGVVALQRFGMTPAA